MRTFICIISIVLLCSCSAEWHLKRSRKHELIAISKGAKVPADTVYKDVPVFITVHGFDSSSHIDTQIDTSAFAKAIATNDSLVLLIRDLESELAAGSSINQESSMRKLKEANSQIRTLRDRLARGFSKDSTYIFYPDSLTTIWGTVKDGVLSGMRYSRREVTVRKDERVPVAINKDYITGYSKLELAGAALLLAIFAFAAGYIARRI